MIKPLLFSKVIFDMHASPSVRIVKHQYYYDPTGNGGLFCVLVKLEFSDGSRTDGYVSSTFLGDNEEGLALLRAYTKRKVGHTALKYMPWV